MQLVEVLQRFKPISLKELDEVKLLNRTDTKFFFSKQLLATALEKMLEYYDVLEIDSSRENHYRTVYFDTPDLLFFNQHHLPLRAILDIEPKPVLDQMRYSISHDHNERGRFCETTKREIGQDRRFWGNISSLDSLDSILDSHIPID